MIKPVCPRCQIDLTRERSRGANYYHCLACMGLTVTVSALKKFVDPQAVTHLWVAARQTQPNSDLTCPYCLQPMRTLLAYQKTPPELDVCLSCHSVWLDHGELKQLPQVKQQKPASLEVRQAIAKMEVENLKLNSGNSNGGFMGAAPASVHKVALAIVGLPVEAHEDKLQTEPVITWTLLALCTLISVLAFSRPLLFSALAYSADKAFAAELLSSFTSFFVHGSWFHLISNMYFLWVIGDNVEDELGKAHYLLLIFAATVAGALSYGWLTNNPSIPLVGASGGIAGLMGFYLLRFPRRKFTVMYFFCWFHIPAWLLIGFYFLKDAIGTNLQLLGMTNVSHISHLGGALVGVGFGVAASTFKRTTHFH